MNAYAATLAFLLPVAASAIAADQPGSPDTVLWDTGTPATEVLPGTAFAARSSWTAVPEDSLAHRFQGDAVAMNDRLAVVLRTQGEGAELYAFSESGAKRRAIIGSLAHGAERASRLNGWKIVENGPGAVVLAVGFPDAANTPSTMTLRLTAGQMIVEVRPGEGVERLLVQSESRYVVVPNFFGDDMVFAADAIRRAKWRLPTENVLLSLAGGGQSQVMCLWSSGLQNATARRSPGPKPGIDGCEIQTIRDKPLWVAVLEGGDRWHEHSLATDDAKRETTLSWRPPFAARWRTDLLDAAGSTRSWYAHDDAAAEPSPLAAERRSPCCLESGRAVLRFDGDEAALLRGPSTMLVYAFDRTRATPLTTFMPIDVLRNTLGVGPCQYILQTESLAADESLTPDSVMTWVEKQFKRKKQKSAAAEIAERLAQMVEHVRHAQSRIEQYGQLAAKLAAPGEMAAGSSTQRLAKELQQAAALTSPVDRAAKLAAEVSTLIETPDAMERFARVGQQLREIGAAQDRALSNCRMTARWIKTSAAMASEDDPQLEAPCKNLEAQVERVLQTR